MDTKTSIIGLAVGAAISLIPAALAKRKGYSFVGWWCYGLLIWPVAIPHVLLIHPKKKRAAAFGQPAGNSPAGGE